MIKNLSRNIENHRIKSLSIIKICQTPIKKISKVIQYISKTMKIK
jgi:hypothetical protein